MRSPLLGVNEPAAALYFIVNACRKEREIFVPVFSGAVLSFCAELHSVSSFLGFLFFALMALEQNPSDKT